MRSAAPLLVLSALLACNADPFKPDATAATKPAALSLPVGTMISMGPQAMEGTLTLAPGETLKVGYDFNVPGSHPAQTVSFWAASVAFEATCASGSGGGTLYAQIGDMSYAVPLNSTAWYPSGDKNSSLVYQGSTTVPDLCNGGPVSLQKGGTFRSWITSTETNKVKVRWHYSGNGSSGGWSKTLGVIP